MHLQTYSNISNWTYILGSPQGTGLMAHHSPGEKIIFPTEHVEGSFKWSHKNFNKRSSNSSGSPESVTVTFVPPFFTTVFLVTVFVIISSFSTSSGAGSTYESIIDLILVAFHCQLVMNTLVVFFVFISLLAFSFFLISSFSFSLKKRIVSSLNYEDFES